jgi:hypothetical protein
MLIREMRHTAGLQTRRRYTTMRGVLLAIGTEAVAGLTFDKRLVLVGPLAASYLLLSR